MAGLDEMNNNIACMLWCSHAIASLAEYTLVGKPGYILHNVIRYVYSNA